MKDVNSQSSKFSFSSPQIPHSLNSSTASVTAALNRFQLLLGDHFSPTKGSQITTGNVPAFPQPPAIHRRFSFPSRPSPDRPPITDRVLSSHTSAMMQLDSTYPKNLRLPTQKNERTDGYEGEFPQLPPHFIDHHSKRTLQGDLPAKKRICMKCWAGVGTIYCDECTAFMCAPCAIVSHTKGAEAKHILSAVGGAAPTSMSDSHSLSNVQKRKKKRMKKILEVETRPSTMTSSRRFSAGSLSEAVKTTDILLNFRPLPDADHNLPPISKKVLRVAEKL